jgi:WS/DGAT/MGAT family acyltransferase
MDGEGALKLMGTLCDFEPGPQQSKNADKAISDARAGDVPSYTESTTKAWQHLAQLPGEAARNAVDILRPKILEQFVWPRKAKADRPTVPTACFNGPISSDRAMTFASLSMAELKAVKEHFGVSLNDVVLALVSSAVRNYLLERADLPPDPLRTNIPVSLRVSGDEQLSNRVTNTTVTLATDLDDPAARLQAIHEESEQAKARAHSGAPGMIELFQMMPPIMVSTLMDSLPEDQAPQMMGANLIVSNVRGSPVPMYMAAARMEKMYPMSILTTGIGINFTCISYEDNMDFGIVVEPDLVPGQETLATGLEAALEEYLALSRPKTATRRKKVAKPRKKSPATGKARPKSVAAGTKPGDKSKAKKPVARRKRS